MKLREIFYLLGLRPRARRYGFEVNVFDLPEDGEVRYAQWLHPGETKKEITQATVDELRTFLRAGDVAIDIGAHSGDTSVPMALAVGPTGSVLALEPNPYVFPVLAKNAELHESIIPLMFAATPTDGELVFEYTDAGFCNGGRHEGISKWRHGHAFKLTVEGRFLPRFLEEKYPGLLAKIRYIKVDAEGFDCSVLESLARLLERFHPFIRAEVYSKTNRKQREQLFHTVARHGYDIYKLENEFRYRGQRLTRDDLTRWRHFDIFCVPRSQENVSGIERAVDQTDS